MSKSKYILGLDLGIASIGWAVYETPNIPSNSGRIIDCGVRIFDAAENPKDKSSLSADRRNARGMRRTIRRKAYRLSCVRKQLVESGLISTIELQNLFAPIKNNKSVESSKNVSFLANYDPQNTEQQILVKQFQQINQQQSIQDFSSYKLNAQEAYNGIYDVYALRYIALDQKISNQHLAQILIHLAKHRGFKSNRKDLAPTSQNAKEKQSVNSSLQNNQKELENYRTIGEMLYVLKQNNSGTKHIKIRNSSYWSDSYHHMFHRENQDGNTIKNIMQEAETILKKQQLLGNLV